jgi:DNA-binding winged helix-turn-helix (wHTH) protein
MNVPLALPKPWREPIDRDGWSTTADRARSTAPETAFEFGKFRVLPRRRQLLAAGVAVELGARGLDILMILIEADGALVTKDELLSRVWAGIVVTPDNLKVQIAALRKALGEDRGLILTDHGRGYRFTAAVRSTTAPPDCLPASGAAGNCSARRRWGVAHSGRRTLRRRRIAWVLRDRFDLVCCAKR